MINSNQISNILWDAIQKSIDEFEEWLGDYYILKKILTVFKIPFFAILFY